MSINHLDAMKTLIAISETGSFSLAAKKLHVQQSSVSRLVSRLEYELDAQILIRTTRKLYFTEAGLKYLSESKKILSQIQSLNEDLKENQTSPKGLLKISLPTALGKGIILSELAGFRNRYPDIDLELHLEDHFVDLVAGSYDVAIRVGESDPSSLTSKKIAVVRRGIFVSRKLQEKLGEIKHPADLSKYPLLSFDEHWNPHTSWNLSQGKQRVKVHFSRVISINQLEGAHLLAQEGLGVVRLPLFMGNQNAAHTPLTQVLHGWEISGRTGSIDRVYALFMGGKHTSAKVRVFVNYLIQRLSNRFGDKFVSTAR